MTRARRPRAAPPAQDENKLYARATMSSSGCPRSGWRKIDSLRRDDRRRSADGVLSDGAGDALRIVVEEQKQRRGGREERAVAAHVDRGSLPYQLPSPALSSP